MKLYVPTGTRGLSSQLRPRTGFNVEGSSKMEMEALGVPAVLLLLGPETATLGYTVVVASHNIISIDP